MPAGNQSLSHGQGDNNMKVDLTHHNRIDMPIKHILVADDVVLQQGRMAAHLTEILPHEGHVQTSFVPGAIMAASIIENCDVDLIILDHDMPYGSGPELLKWLTEKEYKIPVITFSGIPVNNEHLMNLGATYKFQKDEVINGAADNIIKEICDEHIQ